LHTGVRAQPGTQDIALVRGGGVVLSVAAQTLARTLLAQGRPAGDGLVEVPLTVRQIAELVGRSPGTVQTLLRQLDTHGVRVDARRRLFDPQAVLAEPTPAPGADGPRGPDRRSAVALSALVQLVASSPDQLDAALAIATEVLTAVAERNEATTATGTSHAVVTAARVRAVARPAPPQRATARDPERAIARNLEDSPGRKEERENENLFGSESSSLAEASRDTGPSARSTPTGRAPSRDRSATLALIAPLVRACERLGLPGVTNSALLHDRLERYSDAQVRYAVSRLLLEANAGALRSPVGKLASLAERADPDYFVADPPTVTLPGEDTPGPALPGPAVTAAPEVVSRSLDAARTLLRR
jgi:hypothetical protein